MPEATLAEPNSTAEGNAPATAAASNATPPATPATAAPEAQKPATEQKEAPKGDATGKPADTKPAGAPEKYAAFSFAEGRQLHAGVLDAFAGAAKKANLTQEAAQQLLNEVEPALHRRVLAGVEETKQSWLNQTLADAEFAGEAGQANLGIARKALETFAGKDTAALVSWLKETGAGNYLPLLRAFLNAGRRISEDAKVITGEPQGTGEKDHAKAMYRNSQHGG